MKRPLILVFGANPAWQKTLYFDEFRRGEVNRARALELYAGGKGVNFCRAARCRETARTRLYQFSGGANGDLHEAALKRENIDCRAVRVSHETRCCTTLLDRTGAAMTELIEPSHAVSAAEIDEMVRLFFMLLQGQHKDDKNVLHFKTSNLVIESDAKFGTDVDGETGEKLPLHFSVLHRRLKITTKENDI